MKKNILILLIAVVLSAHNADLILQGEKKIVGVVENIIGKDSCVCDTAKTAMKDSTDIFPAINDSLVYGVDISHWQEHEIDDILLNEDSLSFIICKATEGVSYVDSEFEYNWKALDSSKFIRGNYHFYRCNDDPVRQAQFYVSQAGTFSPDNFPPIVDIEEPSKGSDCGTKKAMNNLLIFLKEIKKLTNRVPIIYTNYDFGYANLTNPEFSEYPLWIADNKSEPRLIGSWTSWTIWQKTSHYMIGSKRNDFDVFKGSLTDLKKFIRSTIIEN